MKQRIFLTGATGFIGANLLVELCKQGYTVSALMRKGSAHLFLEGCSFTKVQGDLFSHDVLEQAIKECDAVIHCAALVSFQEKDRREMYHVNVTGTENILKAALKHKKKVIFISTASTMSTSLPTPRLMDETEPFSFQEISPYAHSKHLAERRVLSYVKEGLSAIIVNPSTVYGAGDRFGTGPSLYSLIEKYPIFFAPPGGCSIIAVTDVVQGIIAALRYGKSGERYILTFENVMYKQIFQTIMRERKKTMFPMILLPHFLMPLGIFGLKVLKLQSKTITPLILSYLFGYRFLNNKKACKELHWRPTVSLATAIHEGYSFYLAEKTRQGVHHE